MRTWGLVSALILASISTVRAEDGPDQRFTVNNAMVNGGGQPVAATVLIDGRTGQGWFLVVADNKMQWVPVQFAAGSGDVPNLLPPLAIEK